MKDILIVIIDLGVLAWLAQSLYGKQPVELKQYYWPALAAKVIAGIMVGVIYFYYYGLGDTIAYWQDGSKIYERFLSDPAGTLAFFWDESSQEEFAASLNFHTPRSLFFAKIAGIAAILTAGNYWSMSILLSYLSFLGSWHIFVKVTGYFPSSARASAVAFLFFPSVVFWSSGLIKESLGLALRKVAWESAVKKVHPSNVEGYC